MKQRRYRLVFTLLAAVLVASGFVSCSKSEIELPANDSRVINIKANVQATTNTKAVVVGTTFPANTDNVFRLTAFSGALAPTDWSATPYFNDIQVNSGAASALTFAANQYYPANGDKVFFYGYAPHATSLTAGTAATAPIANYTITGQEDIMAAQETTGIAAVTTGTQPQPALAFTHKLMQLRFKVVADASFETGKKVTQVLVKSVKNSAKLNIATGALTFDGAANQTFTLPITPGTKDDITAGGTEMDGCVMSAPVGTGGSVTLRVTAGGVVYDNINVALTGTNAGTAGTSYLITLTFKRTGITPTAAITDWQSPVDQDADIDGDGLFDAPTVGYYYYTDGSYSSILDPAKTVDGLIFYVDPANRLKFKVMSLEEKLENWKGGDPIPWYDVPGARSLTDGRANSDAVKAFYDAKNAEGVITTFKETFPAFEYCYNYTGKDGSDPVGSWYLPAIHEVQELYCAVNGYMPMYWTSTSYETGCNPDALPVPAAQAVFNAYLTQISAPIINNNKYDKYQSSTEGTYATSDFGYNWCIDFGDSRTFCHDKDLPAYVRCIRSL